MHLQRTKIFVSYSHADVRWLRRLKIHLKPLQTLFPIDCWDDTEILPGMAWHDEISHALELARAAILLVSADFLSSDFIINNELPPLLKKNEDAGATILSIIVSPCLFSRSPLERFQTINPPDQPLIAMKKHEQETLFVRVVETLAAMMEKRAKDA